MAFRKIKKMFGLSKEPLQPNDDAITVQVIEALERNEKASERLRALLVDRNNEMAETVKSLVGNMR
jgi:hypothetical protein